ncbi:alpha-E domain-containing protein [Oceanibacterium hippocampi]|uniref:DUF403 domain-containing protein n=1 Tax=Oceanibacterium hippocampi TaxID=745714 RepID=A0A1Y5T1A3_9PROT|nr:alpha-E domain-containing protein [Oceanibacterium hippocampi]SLN53880.1 hypothetical protein OCH7691_02269 [Oceanibacterium hippocampi]
MTKLLARFAESALWIARYMERAENLARLLDVNEMFSQDRHDLEEWLPIVTINADDERFHASYPAPTVEDVINFYILDDENPTSIKSAVRSARENARMIRHLISTEMWTQLNMFHNRLATMNRGEIRLANLSPICMEIKETCQTHAGIISGTLYRDEVWCFYQIGKYLERADQTTRLLDIKFQHAARPSDDIEAMTDAGLWNALLRSVAGYHAFRREHPRGFKPEMVAGFLINDDGFPRSVAVCLDELKRLFGELAAEQGRPVPATITGLHAALHDAAAALPLDKARDGDLHDYLDGLQGRFIDLYGRLAEHYFSGDVPPPGETRPTQTQTQG